MLHLRTQASSRVNAVEPRQEAAVSHRWLDGSLSAMLASILSISAGASLGALLRWLLAGRFNHLVPALPMGTLAANLIGGYLIGIAVAVFTHMPELSPQARLFVVTGFLGGLTTFSTFSAEVVTQLQQGHTAWALATALAHLLGSFALTALGIATVTWARA
jgi:fluoride exporter